MQIYLVVENEVVQSHDRYLQITRDLLHINLTMHGQSELYPVIRVHPVTAYAANLRGVSRYGIYTTRQVTLDPCESHCVIQYFTKRILHLPENYELIVATKFQNIHLYYDLGNY